MIHIQLQSAKFVIINKRRRMKDELDLSTEHIKFDGKELTRSLVLANTSAHPIIYKAKTNNLHVIEATPNRGIIKPKSAVNLLIKYLRKEQQRTVKLLLTYSQLTPSSTNQLGRVGGELGQTGIEFGETWAKLRPESLKSKYIKVSRDTSGQKIEEQQNVFSSMAHIDDDRDNLLRKTKIYGASLDSIPHQDEEQLIELSQKLKQQKSINSKLKQELEMTEEELLEINRQRMQIKVNKSIEIVCEDYHTSTTTFLLLLLTVFVFGFLLAKFS